MSDPICRNCGAGVAERFYGVQRVPVQTSVVTPTRAEALSIATGDIELALCQSCGLIANVAHPDHVLIPERDYEDQQGFSATFSAFAEGLARSIVERYDLRGKTVLEIGAGKGDFLARLCDLGDNCGVAVDPLCRADRLPDGASERITVVRECYSEAHARFGADLIVCRHTLEHVPDVHRFLRTLRRTVGEAPVVFEVPDATRILAEGAFWDVYYEHCSYFTPDSLTDAFQRAGFVVESLTSEYDGQYLVIHARPGERTVTAAAVVSELADRVAHFAAGAREQMKAWRARVGHHTGPPPAIWGSGSKCVAFITSLGLADAIGPVVDINPHRHGRFLPAIGNEVHPPAALRDTAPDTVIAMNPVYRREIQNALNEMGLNATLLAV